VDTSESKRDAAARARAVFAAVGDAQIMARSRVDIAFPTV